MYLSWSPRKLNVRALDMDTQSSRITFTLLVDDFGIKFEGDNHANHLVSTLKKYYDITVEWKGALCRNKTKIGL